MELDWTTFGLEVINFLILVWLLKRFLYQPVLDVIDRRRRKISADLEQAAAKQADSEALRGQYESRLQDWEREKSVALDALHEELERDRGHKLKQIDEEMEQQRLKHRARDRQLQAKWRSQAEAEALRLGSAFVSRLLQDVSGPELDGRLRQLFIEQLAALPESELHELREGWQGDGSRIEVLSATPLEAQQQETIRQALEQKLGPGSGSWRFDTDETLISGLRVSIGGWMLQANLRDELRFFSEAAAHGG